MLKFISFAAFYSEKEVFVLVNFDAEGVKVLLEAWVLLTLPLATM